MSNIDRAAEVIGEAYQEAMDSGIPSTWRYQIARRLADAGLLMPDLPEPIINADDGNPEWHAGEYTVDVDWGMVNLWTPDGTHWEQTPNQARNLVIALLAAADYAEEENSRADA